MHSVSMQWGSSVGIVAGWMVRVLFAAGEGAFSLFHSVQIGSGAHPASYPLGTRGSFPRGGATEADHSPPYCAKVRNGGAIPPFPHTSSCCHA
jgi:hypothetical protein